MTAAPLTEAERAAVERGKRTLELIDEVHMEIMFERQCLAFGVLRACEMLEAIRLRVVAKMTGAGLPLEGCAS